MAVSRRLRRGDVCLIELNPTRGSEIQKTRPCLIVSPDELNAHLRTLVVAPMTTGGHAYPWRVACRFQNRAGFVAIDQLRTVDRERIAKRLGRISQHLIFRAQHPAGDVLPMMEGSREQCHFGSFAPGPAQRA